jgi:hypothetical protein
MADPNLSEIVSTTLRKRNKKFADNVSKGNALLSRLSSAGKARPVDGGRTIVEELEYAENSTFKYYSGYESLDISAAVVFSAAEFNWKQGAVVVSASGLETEVQNTGVESTIRLLESRIRNAERTMANNVSTGIYSDGTSSGGKQITGLQALCADSPATGTVGGINRANFSFWRNSNYDFSDESVTASKSTMAAAMQTLWLDCTRGNDKPDLITSGKTYYQYYWEGLTDLQRFTSPKEGELGFPSLKFDTADVYYDGDSGLSATRMYMLNTNYIYWRPHVRRNMVPLDRRESVNQDAILIPIVFAGNLTMSNAARQGVIVP